jgi:hypothetical protein
MKKREESYDVMIKKQDEMIESLKSTLAASQPPTNEKLKELYN